MADTELKNCLTNENMGLVLLWGFFFGTVAFMQYFQKKNHIKRNYWGFATVQINKDQRRMKHVKEGNGITWFVCMSRRALCKHLRSMSGERRGAILFADETSELYCHAANSPSEPAGTEQVWASLGQGWIRSDIKGIMMAVCLGIFSTVNHNLWAGNRNIRHFAWFFFFFSLLSMCVTKLTAKRSTQTNVVSFFYRLKNSNEAVISEKDNHRAAPLIEST